MLNKFHIPFLLVSSILMAMNKFHSVLDILFILRIRFYSTYRYSNAEKKFCKKVVLKILVKLTGKTVYDGLLFLNPL